MICCGRCYDEMKGIYSAAARQICEDCGGVSIIDETLQPRKQRALENLKDDYYLPADYTFGREA